MHIEWNKKVDIDNKKVDIDNKKVDIHKMNITNVMLNNVQLLYRSLSLKEYFGRNEICEVLDMSPSGASKLISHLLDKYNVPYEIAYSDNPGKIIYEDDYQVGVIDFDK